MTASISVQTQHDQFVIVASDGDTILWRVVTGTAEDAARVHAELTEVVSNLRPVTVSQPGRLYRLFSRLSSFDWLFEDRPRHKNWGSR